MVTAIDTHEVTNQSPSMAGINLFTSDPGMAALTDGLPGNVIAGLSEHGRMWGAPDSFELGRIANESPPVLRTHDASGRRIDAVEFHPAFHALMRRSVAAGMHCSLWDAGGDEADRRTLARAARLFLSSAVDGGHLAGIVSTNAAVAALGHQPALAETWLPGLTARKYDQTPRRAADKSGLTIGYAATEKQGGTDLSLIASEAREDGDNVWTLTGHKWFVAAPASDALIVLAQTIDGPSAFLVPRIRPDGGRNNVRLMRLKDLMGLKSGAVAELEFEQALAWSVGEGGKGFETVDDMLALMRLDDTVIAAGMMRFALAEAVHHTRHRRASGMALVDQPMMTRVLADMALDSIGASALAFRLAESYDAAANDPNEAAFARLMTPVAKYWIAKIAPTLIAEAMECIGGNGYSEESRLPRILRDAPSVSIRNGTGNAMCLEVMRVLRRSSESLELVLGGVENALGGAAKSSLNVLRAATAVALADEGSARILAEQLAMTVAAAALHQRFPSAVADTFLETRLSKSWRSTYGMLDSRFDSKAFLNYLFPVG